MKNIAFTGAGAIAEAIINGLISDGVCLPGQLVVTNHSNDERLSFLKSPTESQSQETSAKLSNMPISSFLP